MLQRVVLQRHGIRRADVLVHSGIGEDSAIIDFGDEVCVVSTDPITGAGANAGWLAVHISCNDVAANGAEPVGVLPTLMLPEGTSEQEISELMADVHRAATELGVEIIGGHTEITAGLANRIISLTALGRARRDRFVTSAGARPGDALLMTKWAAMEGSAILAADLADRLTGHVPADQLELARGLIESISVVPEGKLAAALGVNALHDATEGGILGAAQELAAASGVGLEIWADRIPVLPATRAICRRLGIDSLRLISSGSMLIAAAEPAKTIEAMRERSIMCTQIGRVIEADAGQWLLYDDRQREPLLPGERDELWRVLADETSPGQ